MRVEIPQTTLLESLKIVSRAVSGANTLPVLGNILLRAEGQQLRLSATNLEISITTTAKATVKNEGAITVPAKVFTSYVSLLDKEDIVELKLTDGLTLEVSTPAAQTKIKGIAADEFPNISFVEGGKGFELPIERFHGTVHQVAFAAQENASRPILSGIYVKSEGKKTLAFVATDVFRLSEKKVPVEALKEELSCLIPVRAFYEADRLQSLTKPEKVSITISENQVMFELGNAKLVSRLIEGQFPPYEQIIPKEAKTTIVVDREALSLAVRRISIFAKEVNQYMKIEVTQDGTLSVYTDATQIGEGRTTLPAEVTGENNAIALNADYVLDLLNAIDAEKVVMKLGSNTTPVVFQPSQESPDFIHLIMPLTA